MTKKKTRVVSEEDLDNLMGIGPGTGAPWDRIANELPEEWREQARQEMQRQIDKNKDDTEESEE